MRAGYRPQKGRIKTDGLPTLDRGFIAHFEVSAEDAVAPSADGVLAATALTDEAQAITEGITIPAVARSLTIKGGAAGMTGDVVITGTDLAGGEITETLALNGTTAVAGTKAFATVTQIDLPAYSNDDNDTVQAGWADKLGLPYRLPYNTLLMSARNGNRESSNLPTLVTDPDELAENTIKFYAALNGQSLDAYLIV